MLNHEDDVWQGRWGRVMLKCFEYFNSLAIFGFLIPLLYYWNDMTPCLQRQSVVVAASLIYWKFRDFLEPGYILEIFQFFIMFLFAERLNEATKESFPTCDEPDTFFEKIIFTAYYFLFGYYMGAVLAFTLLLLGTLIYDCYYAIFLRPRIIRERTIRGSEFEQLEVIKFSRSDQSINTTDNQHPNVCSICLAEFEEREEVIKLPVCKHLYHKPCIRTWLENHIECPYCRANVKENLRIARNQEVEMH